MVTIKKDDIMPLLKLFVSVPARSQGVGVEEMTLPGANGGDHSNLASRYQDQSIKITHALDIDR